MKYIKQFESIGMKDIAEVGGKNASLGEMITQLSAQGITVPTGFAVIADAYWQLLEANHLLPQLKTIFASFDRAELAQLKRVGEQARTLIEQARMPDAIAQEITAAYSALSQHYQQPNLDVAVRSSATAEDSPEASFAGQQETFLNIRGAEAVITACQKSMASLFTDRAIMYRLDKGFDHFKMAISVGVQKMVRSDLAASGVAFSLDTESGFKDVVVINATYGLGESLVQGAVVPDEFFVYKPTLARGFKPIVKKHVGSKLIKKIYAPQGSVVDVPVDVFQQQHLCLTDDEVLTISRAVVKIEDHYSRINNRWMPMDIEWAKDGTDGNIYIIQARPETVHAQAHTNVLKRYRIPLPAQQVESLILVTGQSIGQKIASGIARVIEDPRAMQQVQPGDIIVTRMTDPDWVPVMKKAAGIITTSGGRTCHAAIVSRELGVPAIVGAELALERITAGTPITIDCSKGKVGFVYDGALPFTIDTIDIGTLPTPAVPIMLNLANPDRAYTLSFLPVAGIGLARIEFVISNKIGIHPMALVHPEKITDRALQEQIKQITTAYPDGKTFFIDRLSQEVGTIAAAFYPRPVIVRFSDFKTNEYRNLVGGHYFEPVEANPMIGFRGASRYYDVRYKDAFALECAAMKKVMIDMGLNNIKLMIPFVRTVEEAQRVIAEMKVNGLERGRGLEVFMMIETPSDVLMIDEFSQLFDGFSIGSNDLAQMTLSVDRDSAILQGMLDERLPAVRKMLEMAVQGAKRNKKYIGICGQAPADYPEIASLLVCLGVDSISIEADSVIPFLMSKAACVKA